MSCFRHAVFYDKKVKRNVWAGFFSTAKMFITSGYVKKSRL